MMSVCRGSMDCCTIGDARKKDATQSRRGYLLVDIGT